MWSARAALMSLFSYMLCALAASGSLEQVASDSGSSCSAGLTLASVSTLTSKLTSVLLQHVLLNATTEAQLVAAGEFQSALGVVLNQSYPITVTETGGNVSPVHARDDQIVPGTSLLDLLRGLRLCHGLRQLQWCGSPLILVVFCYCEWLLCRRTSSHSLSGPATLERP